MRGRLEETAAGRQVGILNTKKLGRSSVIFISRVEFIASHKSACPTDAQAARMGMMAVGLPANGSAGALKRLLVRASFLSVYVAASRLRDAIERFWPSQRAGLKWCSMIAPDHRFRRDTVHARTT